MKDYILILKFQKPSLTELKTKSAWKPISSVCLLHFTLKKKPTKKPKYITRTGQKIKCDKESKFAKLEERRMW